jgi:hypothetical protein
MADQAPRSRAAAEVNSARWLVLTWRLSAASSTPRVATWRSLQRLGAVSLTPGAAVLPFTEHLLEQLEWIAEEIVQRGGEAYVLPVTELREADEEEIRRRMRSERKEEYGRLREAAERLLRGEAAAHTEREVAALERGLARTIERDYFESTGRSGAERAIRLAGKRKDG